LLDGFEEVVADLLFEDVPDQLEGIELLGNRHITLGQPADGGAERPASGLDDTLFFEFVEHFEDVFVDLLDVGVVELEHVD